MFFDRVNQLGWQRKIHLFSRPDSIEEFDRLASCPKHWGCRDARLVGKPDERLFVEVAPFFGSPEFERRLLTRHISDG